MPNASLVGAHMKVGRAYAHLNSIRRYIKTFRKREPYGIVREFDPDTNETVWKVKGPVKEPPARLSIVVGDFLFNTRAALDYLAWQLVLMNGQTPTRRTAFPIFGTEWTITKDGRTAFNSKVKGMSRAAIQQIESVQPCRGGNRYLWYLDSLHNADKHRQLTLVTAATDGYFASQKLSNFAAGPVKDGTDVARSPGQYDVNLRVVAGIAFDQTPNIPTSVEMVAMMVYILVRNLLLDFGRARGFPPIPSRLIAPALA